MKKENPTQTTDSLISHISDTARWIALHRAMETERRDALFKDPFARRLAGPEGEKIARGLRYGRSSSWGTIVRTAVYDEYIERCVLQERVDTVVNLGAGLDARPYRLGLPADLHWIEVDLPGILTYKERLLADYVPVCSLERVKMDITDAPARRRLLERVNGESRCAVALTEGLLIYLKREEVASIATDLHSQANFKWWITEYSTPELLEWTLKTYRRQFGTGEARMQFAPAEGIKFFRTYGWRGAAIRSATGEGKRLKREMPFAWLLRLASPLMSKKRKAMFAKYRSDLMLLERV